MSKAEIINERYIQEEERSLNWENLAEKLQKSQPLTRKLPEYQSIQFIIFPDDPFLDFWNTIIIFLLLYTATVVPYRITLQSPDDQSFIFWDTIVDIIYFIDIILNCFLSYYNNDGILITSRRQIIQNYLAGWMLLDLSSCVPVQLILQSDKNYSKVIRIGRLPRLYRLIKMAKLIRMLKVFKSKTQILKYITWACKLEPGVKRLIWFILAILLMTHILACMWVFIGVFYMQDTSVNWVFQSGLQDSEPIDLYITGFYWCVTTLATVGYGDIHPYNTTERIYTSGVMIIGIFVYSYIIGSLTNLLSNLDSKKAKLNKLLNILDGITEEYGFNQKFHKKLSLALEYKHSDNKQEVSELLEDIPGNLRTQFLVLIYQKILESNTFFENKPSYFVAYVAPLLKPVRFDADEYIYRQNEYAKEMYFIIKGDVAMITNLPNSLEEIPFNALKDSYYFGETDILFSEGKQRRFSIKSMGKCELLSFDHIDFENMLKNFEEESLEIMTLAHQRDMRLESKREQAIKLFIEKNELRKITSLPVLDIPKNLHIVDIIDESRSNSIVEQEIEEEALVDQKSLAPRDELLSIPKFLSVSSEKNNLTIQPTLFSNKTLYSEVLEEKLVKEEDNLKVAKNKISEIESRIQECLNVMKNVTEFFDIQKEEGLIRFSSNFMKD